MRAMLPDGAGSVRLGEAEEPSPGRDEIVLAVAAYSINRGETFLLEAPKPGWRPGKDVAGVVTAVGADVTGIAVGARAVAHVEHSGWAERVAVPARQVALLPEQLPLTVAAALPLAGLTALRLLRVIGAVAGRRILLTGASGGVGHYFVELAAAHGAEITALVGSAERGQRLSALGAEVVTDITEAGNGFDVVIESVGGELFTAAWHRLTPRGTFVWMGQAGRTPPTFDFLDWTGGYSATLRKFLYWDTDEPDGADLATLVRLAAGGRLHPEIGLLADWTRTAEVLDALLGRRVRGNAVLEVAS